jgi:hypothetical protein
MVSGVSTALVQRRFVRSLQLRLHFAVKTSSELSVVEREQVWNIFESNMRPL